MCPFCLASVAMMIVGATSTGGIAVAINRFRVKKIAGTSGQTTQVKETKHDDEADGTSEDRVAS